MAFPRQEYWSGLSFPSSGDFPDPDIKPASLALASWFFTTEPPRKPLSILTNLLLTHDLWGYDNYHHTRTRFQKALLLLLKIHVCAFCDSFISAIQAGSIYSKPDKGNEFIWMKMWYFVTSKARKWVCSYIFSYVKQNALLRKLVMGTGTSEMQVV